MVEFRQNSIWSTYVLTRVDQRLTRKEKFLDRMDRTVPWSELLNELGEDNMGGKVGRRPIGVERKLRIYLVQQWYDLSDRAIVEMMIDVPSVAAFCGFDASVEKMPSRTTLFQFRKWLQERGLVERVGDVVEQALASQRTGIVRYTISEPATKKSPSKRSCKSQVREN